jgi:hypothetical protein
MALATTLCLFDPGMAHLIEHDACLGVFAHGCGMHLVSNQSYDMAAVCVSDHHMNMLWGKQITCMT